MIVVPDLIGGWQVSEPIPRNVRQQTMFRTTLIICHILTDLAVENVSRGLFSKNILTQMSSS